MNHVSELTTARADYARHTASAAAIEMKIIGAKAQLKRDEVAFENANRLAEEALAKVEHLENNPPEVEAVVAVETRRSGPLFPVTPAPVDTDKVA